MLDRAAMAWVACGHCDDLSIDVLDQFLESIHHASLRMR